MMKGLHTSRPSLALHATEMDHGHHLRMRNIDDDKFNEGVSCTLNSCFLQPKLMVNGLTGLWAQRAQPRATKEN